MKIFTPFSLREAAANHEPKSPQAITVPPKLVLNISVLESILAVKRHSVGCEAARLISELNRFGLNDAVNNPMLHKTFYAFS